MSGLSFNSSFIRSRLPEMTANRLLKSWAMPPVSWPNASVFWAWRSCSSACLVAVTSVPIVPTPMGLPFALRTGNFVTRTECGSPFAKVKSISSSTTA